MYLLTRLSIHSLQIRTQLTLVGLLDAGHFDNHIVIQALLYPFYGWAVWTQRGEIICLQSESAHYSSLSSNPIAFRVSTKSVFNPLWVCKNPSCFPSKNGVKASRSSLGTPYVFQIPGRFLHSQDYLNLNITQVSLMSLLMDLYNLDVSLHSGQTQDRSDFKLPTNFFLFLPLNAYWKTHCLLRKYTWALPKVFPPPLPEPPITWNIPFALEKQTLSRSSQLWFFISNFPCLTWRVKSGNASSLTPERCLQSFLCDPVGGWKVLRASGSGKKASQVSDDDDPKGLVKSRKMAVVSFMALLCLPPLQRFLL